MVCQKGGLHEGSPQEGDMKVVMRVACHEGDLHESFLQEGDMSCG